jgi:NitT/TauT family transport system substrate-binding protein
VTRVATGAYEMGFADFNALVEYDAKTPGSKIQAGTWSITPPRRRSLP